MANTKELLLPRLGETMEEGTLVSWQKNPGDSYKRGEIIAEIETDKTVVELPALEDGKFVKPLIEPGTKLDVGKPIALIESAGGKVSSTTKTKQKKETKAKTKSVVALPTKTATSSTTKVLASPNAKRIANEKNIDISKVVGTGRYGRVTGKDVHEHTSTSQSSLPAHFQLDEETGIAIQYWPAKNKTHDTAWLFMHGFFGNSASWQSVGLSLNNLGFDVYAAELPGHGMSKPAKKLDINLISKNIVSTLRKKYSGPIRIAGISLGAVFATEIATLDSKAESLSLLCPCGLGTESNQVFIQTMINATNADEIKPALKLLGKTTASFGKKAIEKMVQDVQERRKNYQQIEDAWFPEGLQKLSIRSQLASLKIPIKILFSVDDEVVSWQHAANAPDNVAVHFLEGVGHMPHLDNLQKVINFLTNKY